MFTFICKCQVFPQKKKKINIASTEGDVLTASNVRKLTNKNIEQEIQSVIRIPQHELQQSHKQGGRDRSVSVAADDSPQ